MLLMQQRILRDGVVRDGNILAVDSFLNHQMDPELYQEMGREFYRLFGGCGVTKILTVEASGIGIACVAAQFFGCPALFAKKGRTKNLGGGVRRPGGKLHPRRQLHHPGVQAVPFPRRPGAASGRLPGKGQRHAGADGPCGPVGGRFGGVRRRH